MEMLILCGFHVQFFSLVDIKPHPLPGACSALLPSDDFSAELGVLAVTYRPSSTSQVDWSCVFYDKKFTRRVQSANNTGGTNLQQYQVDPTYKGTWDLLITRQNTHTGYFLR